MPSSKPAHKRSWNWVQTSFRVHFKTSLSVTLFSLTIVWRKPKRTVDKRKLWLTLEGFWNHSGGKHGSKSPKSICLLEKSTSRFILIRLLCLSVVLHVRLDLSWCFLVSHRNANNFLDIISVKRLLTEDL